MAALFRTVVWLALICLVPVSAARAAQKNVVTETV